MNYTVNGKNLNAYHPLGTKITDNSGNELKPGDLVFHISGSRSRTYSIKTVVLLTEDNTNIQFLGVKLDNGQFSDLYQIDCFKVDKSFAKIHPKYVSKSHAGFIEEFVHFSVDLDIETASLNVPLVVYETHKDSFEELFSKQHVFEWYSRGTLQQEESFIMVEDGKTQANMSNLIQAVFEEALADPLYPASFKKALKTLL